VKDMPPAVTGGLPKITRPEIYYGETSNTYALVGTRSKELDYPAGDQNVYATYRGRGGISIATWARKLLFAARFGEKNLLLSNDLTADSRLMMYRAVGARLQQIAPFFSFDPDPYIVVTPAGRLVWLIDGYTTTDRYPYSEPAQRVGSGQLPALTPSRRRSTPTMAPSSSTSPIRAIPSCAPTPARSPDC